VDSVSALANNINDIIGDADNKANVKQTLANVNALTDQATKTLESIQGFTDTGTDVIAKTADRLDATLAELQMVLAKANTGDGTAAKLLNDGRLYDNLIDTTEELKVTSEQLKIITTEIKERKRKIITLW
jgi:phospholipid/cholesterol/gamma-HCH transport system substrate-binding protein